MASYTYEQLKDMTVAQLREVAQGVRHDAVEGYSTMHKEQLLPALCKALDIHMHHAAVGAQKTRIKGTIRKLKVSRGQAIGARDYARLTTIRQHIHALKRKLRRMVVPG